MPSENFDIADEDDKVIGKASRDESHAKNLIHRSVMFFIFDGKGRVLVSKRTQNKDFFPGFWSIVLGGHVISGESYEDAAAREIEEEVGIRTQPFFIDSFKKRIPEEKENVKVFGAVVGDEITLNPEELTDGEFLEMEELEDRIKEQDFLPETEVLLPILKRHMSSQSLQNL